MPTKVRVCGRCWLQLFHFTLLQHPSGAKCRPNIIQLLSYRAGIGTQVCGPLKSTLVISILHTPFCIAFFVVILNILQSPLSATLKARFDQSTCGSVSWLAISSYTQPLTFKTFRRKGRSMQQHLVSFPQRWGNDRSVQDNKTQQCLSNSIKFWLWNPFTREQPTF